MSDQEKWEKWEDRQIADARQRDQQRAQDLGAYTPVEQVLALATEVERLRKQVALFRPIVEAVAADRGSPYRGGPVGQVSSSDLVDMARAALASDEQS